MFAVKRGGRCLELNISVLSPLQVQLFSLEDVTNFTGQTVDGNQVGSLQVFALALPDMVLPCTICTPAIG